MKFVSLRADTRFLRTWKGVVKNYKAIGNFEVESILLKKRTCMGLIRCYESSASCQRSETDTRYATVVAATGVRLRGCEGNRFALVLL